MRFAAGPTLVSGGDSGLHDLKRMCGTSSGVVVTGQAVAGSGTRRVRNTGAADGGGFKDPAGLREVPLFAPRVGVSSRRASDPPKAPGRVTGRPSRVPATTAKSAPTCKSTALERHYFNQPIPPDVAVDAAGPLCQLHSGREAVCDSDGEEILLCPECGLPMGACEEVPLDGKAVLMHGECKASLLLAVLKDQEEVQVKTDKAKKKKHRETYNIGWKAEQIPRNEDLTRPMSCTVALQGMCGVVLQEGSRSIQLVQTSDPAASVNLEYLSLALQVRRGEGREPIFSLDPDYDRHNLPGYRGPLWQKKRIEPLWLAGTSIGEVMFQADYHLKELSMGEYSQPVIGMPSCFDLFQEEGKGDSENWMAREWFIVKSGEIQISGASLLMPVVEMGVEARELARGPDGVEDARITRSDHPLVRYAEAFTHNFALIAERKSVVNQLREVAKACLLAKFLVESQVHLEEYWISWAEEACRGKTPAASEIPQLWNEQRHHHVHLMDGKTTEPHDGMDGKHRVYGVYGGVEMSLDRIELANLMVSAKKSLVVSAAIPAQARVPQGVDLSLDRCDLLTSARPGPVEIAGSWNGVDLAGSAFWKAIKADSGSTLSEDDKALLRDVFNPHLSDRRDEGELFRPPDARDPHASVLRRLVKEEESVQQQRQAHFFSKSFAMESPGPLFPFSWMPSLAMTRERGPPGPSERLRPLADGLHERPDYLAEAPRLAKSAAPVFDRCTEDGTRFRVYRIGSLEVRTAQKAHGGPALSAVFSHLAPVEQTSRARSDCGAPENERIVKVKQCVESARSAAAAAAGVQPGKGPGLEWGARLPPERHFYTEMETDQGNVVVAEMLKCGKIAWSVNPPNLEARSSLARVIRSADCRGAGVRGLDIARHCETKFKHIALLPSQSVRKQYAREAYNRAAQLA